MLGRGSVIFLCALALLAIGVVMVNSAQMRIEPVSEAPSPTAEVAADPVTLPAILRSREAIYAGVALGVLIFVSRLPAGWLDRPASMSQRHRWTLVTALAAALVCVLLAVYLPGIGKAVNGAHRWIRAPLIGQFQPSELAKWSIVPLLVWTTVGVRARPETLRGAMVPLVLLAMVTAIIVLEDLGTAVLIAGAGTMVLVAAGLRLWLVGAVAALSAPLLSLAVLTSAYRVDRVVTFIDPFNDPRGEGYHLIQSLATIGGGGLFGRGLGSGLQKFGYLPEDRTDFLFAVVCEELGLAGAALVCCIYVLLFAALSGVVRRATTPARRLFAFGVLVMLTGQTLINLFVVTGLGPTKGIALPLMSAGGTGWVLIAAALGAVIAIDRETTPDAAVSHPEEDAAMANRRAATIHPA